jgi:hypothetical protein
METNGLLLLSLVPIWSQMNICHVFVTYLSDNHFNNIKMDKRKISDKFSHLNLDLPSDLPSSRFPSKV